MQIPAEAEPGAVGGSRELGDDLGLCKQHPISSPSSMSFTPVREESEVVEGTHTEPKEEGGMWRHGITTEGTTADQTKKQHEPKKCCRSGQE